MEKLNLLFVDTDKYDTDEMKGIHDKVEDIMGPTLLLPKDVDLIQSLSLSQLFSVRDLVNYYINRELEEEGYFDDDEDLDDDELDDLEEDLDNEVDAFFDDEDTDPDALETLNGLLDDDDDKTSAN